jgi:hypothetical protein
MKSARLAARSEPISSPSPIARAPSTVAIQSTRQAGITFGSAASENTRDLLI